MGMMVEIEQRRSYRAIDPRRVSEESVDRMLDAATLAPSCSNSQPWRFIAITDSAHLTEVKRHLSPGNYWAKLAPLIVAVCVDPADDCRNSHGRDYGLFDTGMATQNLMLQAVSEGVYTHPVAGFDPGPVKALLNVPERTILVILVIAGYRGDADHLSEKHAERETGKRERKQRSEVVGYERYQTAWGNQAGTDDDDS